MDAIKIDLEIPYWCSFKEFGTVSSHLTYPFPPPPTIFGMLLNALGKLSLHTIENDQTFSLLEKEYFAAFSKLKFSIVIRDAGKKIDDYSCLLKRNRGSDSIERELSKTIKAYCKTFLNKSQLEWINKNCKTFYNDLGKYKSFIKSESFNSTLECLFKEDFPKGKFNVKEISNKLKCYISYCWKSNKFFLVKDWQQTQVMRQRLIKPKFTVFVLSENNDEYSLESLMQSLRFPKRPLYLGESDDFHIMTIESITIQDHQIYSNKIDSVIPKVVSNSIILNIPISLRNQPIENGRQICSIPNGKLDEEIKCYKIEGDNIVFL